MSEATQQETLVLVLRNTSASGCALRGYPEVVLVDGQGATLPFRVRRAGDQMLTGAGPALVALPPGADAYVGVNQTTCDAHAGKAAARIRLTPPGARRALTLPVSSRRSVGYCPPGTPGHVVDVTPIEPARADVFARH